MKKCEMFFSRSVGLSQFGTHVFMIDACFVPSLVRVIITSGPAKNISFHVGKLEIFTAYTSLRLVGSLHLLSQ